LTRQVTECFGFKPDGSYSMRHLPVGHDEPLRAELIAFLDAVRTGNVPAVSGDEGVASLEIAIRCSSSPPNRGLCRAQGPAPHRRLKLSIPIPARPHEPAHASRTLPFYDLGSQRRRLGTSIDEAISRVTSHCSSSMVRKLPCWRRRWRISAALGMS